MLSPNMTSNYCYWLGFERHHDNQFVRVPDDGRQAVQNFEGWAERYSPQDQPGWKHFSVFYRPNNTHHAQLYMMPPYSQCHFVCEPKQSLKLKLCFLKLIIKLRDETMLFKVLYQIFFYRKNLQKVEKIFILLGKYLTIKFTFLIIIQ